MSRKAKTTSERARRSERRALAVVLLLAVATTGWLLLGIFGGLR